VVAGLAGISKSRLSLIERGECALESISEIVTLADVLQIHQRTRACQFVEIASALPQLIRDLHATLSTGSDHGELLGLAVRLHVHVVRVWLGQAGASADLRRRVVFLARRLAHEHGAVTTVGVAAFGVADVLAGGGVFDLALTELDDITLPATTADTVGLRGFRRSSTWLISRSRARRACLSAAGPGGMISIKSCRRLLTGSRPA
jgi:transcriptional regulator with XRE-family HTH domain